MPWDSQSIRKHNKGLKGPSAAKAAAIANAVLRRTGDEGLALATANARAKGQKPQKHDKPFGSFAP